MNAQPQLPSDGQLTVAARDGMVAAWNELARRHGGAVAGVAKARSRRGSKKATERALDDLHASIIAGDVVPDGEPGIRAVRPRAIALLTGGAYGPGSDADLNAPPADLAELRSLARSFSTLPEPWQTALWHRTVELHPAAEFAPLLGRTANEATAVVQRAEAGLFERFLLDQASDVDGTGVHVDPACAPIVPLLGGSLRTTLSAHQQRLVDDHLDNRPAEDDGDPGCTACRRRLAVRDDMATLLPAALVPGLAGLSVQRYRAAVGARPQPSGTAFDELHHDRVRRVAFLGALVAVLLAVTAAVVLIRDPFDGDATPDAIGAVTTPDATGPSTPVESSGTIVTADDATDETTTSSTEIALRPPITGPGNTIELVFAEGARAVGFATPPADLVVELSSPAPIFAGGTGTIDVSLTNVGATPAITNFSVLVPVGVTLDRLVDGVAECLDPEDDSAFCNATVEPGQTSLLSLRFTLTKAIVGRFVVETNTRAETLEAQISAVPRLVHSSVGRGDILMIGNTLMTCAESDPNCLAARDGAGDVLNRWDMPAEFVNLDPTLGWANSSSATLDTGTASGIEAAYLFWSGDLSERNVSIPDDGSSTRISILAPNAELPLEIDAQNVRLGDVDATQYFGFADVTALVQASGPGDYVVGDVQSVEVQGSYAGWSLVVVTNDDSMPRRELVVTSPFSWFSPDDTFSIIMPVPFAADRVVSLDVLAFEGERTFVPEQFAVGGVPLGDAGAFDSSITGTRNPLFDNNFGIDIDTYALRIDAPDGTLPVEATSGKDGIRLSVLGLTVDLK